MKYFVVQEQDYDDVSEYVWEVDDRDSKIYLALEKQGEFGDLINILGEKPKDYEYTRSFNEYLEGVNQEVRKYLDEKKNYRSWKNIIKTKGSFSGASLGTSMDGKVLLKEGEQERWDATMGVQFIEETQRVINRLDKAHVLSDVLKRVTDASP
jgi:hypothetical protein